jgi:hypothetical protein
VNFLLNGLSGPIHGKTCTDAMAPFDATNTGGWVVNLPDISTENIIIIPCYPAGD